MRFPRYLGRSIGLTQAVAVLLASLVIGCVLSLVHLINSFSAQREEATALTAEFLTLAEGAATSAAWTLDPQLAMDVVTSMTALLDVQSANLVDENGSVLANAEGPVTDYGRLASWVGKTFFSNPVGGERALFTPVNDERQRVGQLSIVLSSARIADRLVAAAAPVLISSLLQAVAIGLMLLWLSSRLVTSPLRRVATAIAAINPEYAQASALPIPVAHQNNEMGNLLRHTNDMLRRLATVQHQLRELATHDALTGLPNRAAVTERLSHALSVAKRNRCKVGVLFLDLDRFKTINDSLGHDVGDELLIAAGRRLTKTLRGCDTVGRLGGDEFLLVLEDIESFGTVIATVRRISSVLSDPFAVDSHEVRTAGSIGIAIYPDDGDDANTLMRHADLAMYSAKGAGGDQWQFFAKEMSAEVQKRMQLETDLRGALERGELFLVYQPKIDCRTGAVAGCEALLRWQRRGELLNASQFIHIAEDTGLIIEIGYWVLQQACMRIRKWSNRFQPTAVSVNVSARQLREPDFAQRVMSVVGRHGIDPRLLELEITETVLIDELDRGSNLLSQLRGQGIAVSIDDFGIGYSSLSYLTRLPINSLKIDRSFVSGPMHSEVVLNIIIALARAMELRTVAEGVESEAQRDWLIAEGCDLLQGHLISEALAEDEFEAKYFGAPAIAASKLAVDK